MHIGSFFRSLLFVLVVLAVSAAAFGQVHIAVTIAPPALPIYEQPLCPGDGYLWTPGYWDYDYDDSDYFWVPGTWILAPEVGFLWTPPYWGWNGSGFMFYDGYWGPQVGFYGGIAYGFGYFGVGFEGGRWDDGHFFYNRAAANINVNVIHNVYNTTVNNVTVNRVSYNGGEGGVTARPTPEQEAASHERHVGPVAAQTQHIQAARSNRDLRASVNHGKPSIAATAKPGEFKGEGVVVAREAGAPYKARSENNAARPENDAARTNPVHPNDLSPVNRPAAPNTGNAKLDKKYQQQQEKLVNQQNKERQKLQQQQEKDHQKMAKQQANDAKKQQMEQHHQQQTQQLQQRHTEQMNELQQRQAMPRGGARPPKG